MTGPTGTSSWLSFEEARAYLRIGKSTLRRWIRAGKIKPHQPGKEYYFDREMLSRLVEGR